MKKLVSFILAVVLTIGACLTAAAAEPTQEELLAQYYAALEKQQAKSNTTNGINYNNRVFITLNKNLGKGKYECKVFELAVFNPADIKKSNVGKKIKSFAGKEYTLITAKDVFKSKNEKYDKEYISFNKFDTEFGVKSSTGTYDYLKKEVDGMVAYDAWEGCIAWEEHFVVEKLTLSPNAVVDIKDWADDILTNDNPHLCTGKDFMNMNTNNAEIVFKGMKYYTLKDWWATAKIQNNVITELNIVFSGQ